MGFHFTQKQRDDFITFDNDRGTLTGLFHSLLQPTSVFHALKVILIAFLC